MKSRIDNIKFALSIFFLAGFALTIIVYSLYKHKEKASSKEYYTVCMVTGKYITSKDMGRKLEYFVNGKRYEQYCTSSECFDLEIGSRFIVKFWDKHPEWADFYPDKPVPDNVEPPIQGWEELPDFSRNIE